jgi:alcohol dehydrogenase (cytochrome c)
MKLFGHRPAFAALALVLFAASHASLLAQNLSNDELFKPPSNSWPLYHGDYSGRRHSQLTQITPRNVEKLGLAWAFQTNKDSQIKSSPLLVDGVLYFTVPDNVGAIDVRSGHML